MKKIFTILVATIFMFSGSLFAQNYALDFDGTDDKVGILDSPELNPVDALTLEAWINAEDWQSSIWAGVIISKQGNGPDKGWCLSAGENGRLEFTISMDGAWKIVNTPSLLGTNAWYHVAGVYDGASVKIYINGVLINTEEALGTVAPGTGVVVNIGENPTWGGRFFNGKIDEVRIWNIARTETEIQENMSIELTGSETGLVGYFPMNEGTGTTTADVSGNGNDGTLLNMNEDTWVDGFEPVTADMGITGIASPSVIGNGFSSEEDIKIEVKNYATTEVTSFEVSYQINGGEVISETVNMTIPPFETYIHTFAGTEDLSGETEVEFVGTVELEGDGNLANDQIIQTIAPTLNYMIFDAERHNYGGYGQTHTQTIYMPEDLGDYSEIYIHIDLECPTGGCDPWDQPAKFMIEKDGEIYEILRYITPYGVACGGWTWDITDFRSLLVDEVDFISYVQVWGASGWLVNVELELVEGTPAYPFVKVNKLWCEDYWVYGDPDINDDFPAMDVMVHPETEAAKIRMTMTGHGQANTSNAAEFSNFTHHIWVDGVETFEQHLWKPDCDANTCSPQSGTWPYARAGWCPGQDVQPLEYDMEDHFTPGEMVNLDYVLYDYTNLLNTGYNGGSHTEPHYRCHTYFVQYSNEDIVGISDQSVVMDHIQAYPNPTTGLYNIKMVNDNIKTIDVYQLNSQLVASYKLDGSQEFQLDLSDMPNGIYMIKVQSEKHTTVLKTVKSN